jgi:hypothetical protein
MIAIKLAKLNLEYADIMNPQAKDEMIEISDEE